LESALSELYTGIDTADWPFYSDITSGFDDVILSWPCHWNKLHEGEVVEIPLYVESDDGDTNGDGILDPDELGLDEFYVRIRPACNPLTALRNPEICDDVDRYLLFSDPYDANSYQSMEKEDTIVSWNITGTDINNGDNILIESASIESVPIEDERSHIAPRRINNLSSNPYSDYIVLHQNSKTKGKIGDTVYSNPPFNISLYLPNLHKSVLSLSGIYLLKNGQDQNIPYLEYQVLIPCDGGTCVSAVGDVGKIIKVEAEIDNVKISKEDVIRKKPGQLKFVIHQ